MAVGLQLAGKNDFVRVQEDINDNLIKLDEAIDFNLLATLGIEYGGILNNTEAKLAGKAYYDTTGKKLYKCVANTNINYADAGYFEALSNNDLLGKLQNLGNEQYVCVDYPYSLIINTAGFELISDTRLNHVIRATKKGKYIIASTMRSSSTAGEDCSIGISKNNDKYSVAFTLMAGAYPSVFEMTPSITRVVSLDPGDTIDIFRTKAEPSKPQRTISILKI